MYFSELCKVHLIFFFLQGTGKARWVFRGKLFIHPRWPSLLSVYSMPASYTLTIHYITRHRMYRAADSLFILVIQLLFSLQPLSSSSPVQHEEHGTGAALPSVWWDSEAAHHPALPAQCVSALCSWGVGTKRLSSSRSPSRALLTILHTQHPIPTTDTQTCSQDAWSPGAGP